MSKCVIDAFIDELRGCERFLSEKYELDSNPFLTDVVFNVRNRDVGSLLKLFDGFKGGDFFSFPHPVLGVDTFSLVSEHSVMCNFILMADRDMKNPWLLCQSENFIDTFFMPGGIVYYIIRDSAASATKANLKGIIKNKFFLENLYLNKKAFSKLSGLVVSSNRPFHFFYDQFFTLNELKEKGNLLQVFYGEQFFPVGVLSKSKKKENIGVYLSPKTIGLTYFSRNEEKVRCYIKPMENKVLNSAYLYVGDKVKSILNNDSYFNAKKLVLWLGLSSEKRGWLDSKTHYSNILNKLCSAFSEVTVVYDGMTASVGGKVNTDKEREIFDFIVSNTPSNITHIPVFGEEYAVKIMFASKVDIAITSGGSAAIVPLRICHKPTVIHTNKGMSNIINPPSKNVVFRERKLEYTLTVDENLKQQQHASYHIPWQHIFNLSVDIINVIKEVRIEQIKVPSVESVAEDYRVMKNYNFFEKLENVITPRHKSADILREVAISFERTKRVDVALEIMKQALILRPGGAVIKRKVKEYSRKMNGKVIELREDL